MFNSPTTNMSSLLLATSAAVEIPEAVISKLQRLRHDSTEAMSLSSSCSSRRESLEVGATPTATPPTSKPGSKRRRKKRPLAESLSSNGFKDVYYLTGDSLGEGSAGRVETCINMNTDVEYAVKIISKESWTFSRAKVLKEVELYYLCQGHQSIIQLIEYFEEPDNFYLVFEKMFGGQLLDQIQSRVHFTEEEAVRIVRDLATALKFLHKRGIAHRDLKPENILCVDANSPTPVKLCDFDLCSSVHQTISTPLLQSPVGSAEYMAPEVVSAFAFTDRRGCMYDDDDDDDELVYDKKCDLWSLGVITYILLCGYLPFSAGRCPDGACNWNSGGECPRCQRALFTAIQEDALVFPQRHWANISPEAKDLISGLLVRDATLRFDADAILAHPWVQCGGQTGLQLETPAVLRRQTSVKEFSELMSVGQLVFDDNNNNGINSDVIRKMSMPASMSQSLRPRPQDRKISYAYGAKLSVQQQQQLQQGRQPMMRRQTSMILAEEVQSMQQSLMSQRFEF